MTSATKSNQAFGVIKRSGFTLVELLVSIGIIVLLIGILLPAITRAYRTAERTRVAADFQTIATGLDAYKADFGTYPTVDAQNTGASILCKALVGPYDAAHFYTGTSPDDISNPAYTTSPPTANDTMQNTVPAAYSASTAYNAGDVVLEGSLPTFAAFSTGTANVFFVSLINGNAGHDPATLGAYWAVFNPFDGKDGVGVRERFSTLPDGTGTPVATAGKTYGPYLQTESVHIQGINIVDRWAHPILYFPANKTNVGLNGYISAQTYPPAANTPRPMINSNDNIAYFYKDPMNDTAVIAKARLYIVAGDYNVNGALNNAAPYNEPSAPNVNFFLWSSGPDGIFGPTGTDNAGNADGRDFDSTGANYEQNRKAADKCDDITNFRQ